MTDQNTTLTVDAVVELALQAMGETRKLAVKYRTEYTGKGGNQVIKIASRWLKVCCVYTAFDATYIVAEDSAHPVTDAKGKVLLGADGKPVGYQVSTFRADRVLDIALGNEYELETVEVNAKGLPLIRLFPAIYSTRKANAAGADLFSPDYAEKVLQAGSFAAKPVPVVLSYVPNARQKAWAARINNQA